MRLMKKELPQVINPFCLIVHDIQSKLTNPNHPSFDHWHGPERQDARERLATSCGWDWLEDSRLESIDIVMIVGRLFGVSLSYPIPKLLPL